MIHTCPVVSIPSHEPQFPKRHLAIWETPFTAVIIVRSKRHSRSVIVSQLVKPDSV
jgi:hypothetical protein